MESSAAGSAAPSSAAPSSVVASSAAGSSAAASTTIAISTVNPDMPASPTGFRLQASSGQATGQYAGIGPSNFRLIIGATLATAPIFSLDTTGHLISGTMLATQVAGFVPGQNDFIVFQTPAQISSSGNVAFTCIITGDAFTCNSQGSEVFNLFGGNIFLDPTAQAAGPGGNPAITFNAVPI